MRVSLTVTNSDGEAEYHKVLDTKQASAPHPPVQTLLKIALNGALADVIEWEGRTLTIEVE